MFVSTVNTFTRRGRICQKLLAARPCSNHGQHRMILPFVTSKRQQHQQRQSSSSSSHSKASSSTPSSLTKWITATGALTVCLGLDFVAPNELHHGPTYWSETTTDNSSSNTDKVKKEGFNGNDNNSRSHLLPSSKPHNAHVVIVGGGMAGLHTALALKEQQNQEDTKVTILEGSSIGNSASGKSKGLVVAGLQVPQDELAQRIGSKVAQQVYDLTYQAEKRLKNEIINKYNIDCDYIESAMVEASIHPIEEEEEEDNEDDDGDCRMLTAAEVRKYLGQPDTSKLYQGGEYDPHSAGIHPLKLTQGLALVLETRFQNVQIHEHTKAMKIEKMDTNTTTTTTTTSTTDDNKNQKKPIYKITTESGAEITCHHVVLCTGPEHVSKALSKQLVHSIIPVHTWMASTEPLGDKCPLPPATTTTNDTTNDTTNTNNNKNTTKSWFSLPSIFKSSSSSSSPSSTTTTTTSKTSEPPVTLCGDDYVCLNYWRRTPDGRLLFGSLADTYPVPVWFAKWRLQKALANVYPQLANVKLEHVWGGTLAISRYAVPLIGRDTSFDTKNDNATTTTKPNFSNGGVWYATGFAGHGIVPTVMAGTVIANAILGQSQEWTLFQQHFQPEFIWYPVSRIGAQLVFVIYNIWDWLHVNGVPVPKVYKPW